MGLFQLKRFSFVCKKHYKIVSKIFVLTPWYQTKYQDLGTFMLFFLLATLLHHAVSLPLQQGFLRRVSSLALASFCKCFVHVVGARVFAAYFIPGACAVFSLALAPFCKCFLNVFPAMVFAAYLIPGACAVFPWRLRRFVNVCVFITPGASAVL